MLSMLELPLGSEVRSSLLCPPIRKRSISRINLLQAFAIGEDILSIMSSRKSFADAVAREAVLWRLVQVVQRPDASENVTESSEVDASGHTSRRKVLGWSVLEALSSSPAVASQILSSSTWIELLGVLAGYSEFTKVWAARSGSARTLSRLLWDPTTGSAIGTQTRVTRQVWLRL